MILLTLVVTFQFCTESDNKNFLKDKAALVFSLIFVCDYPEKASCFIVISSVTVENHNFSHTECHLSATQHLQQHNHHKNFSKNKGKIEKRSWTQYTAVKLTHTFFELAEAGREGNTVALFVTKGKNWVM